jgi:hypothetical protein
VTENPTCEDKGNIVKKCSRGNCDYEKNDDIEALGHEYTDGKCIRCGKEQAGGAPITFIKIDSLPITTVSRNQQLTFGLILNEGASSENVIWSVSNKLFATVDNNGTVTIQNHIGTTLLKAYDPDSGLSASISLRIAS